MISLHLCLQVEQLYLLRPIGTSVSITPHVFLSPIFLLTIPIPMVQQQLIRSAIEKNVRCKVIMCDTELVFSVVKTTFRSLSGVECPWWYYLFNPIAFWHPLSNCILNTYCAMDKFNAPSCVSGYKLFE